MLPVLLVSNNTTAVREYVDGIALSHKIKDIYFFGEKETISIEEIRDINKEIIQPAFRMRMYVLFDFDKVKKESQNAFLKTLEERNEHNAFILVMSDEYKILSTIQSRCKVVRQTEVLQSETSILDEMHFFDVGASLADFLSASSTLSKGSHAAAIHQMREYFYALAREKSLSDAERRNVFVALEKVIEVEYQLSNNIYPEFTLDYLVIFLCKEKLLPLRALS